MSNRLISFSLYGTDPKYLGAALQIVSDTKEIFPGYLPRFYVSQEIEEGLITHLKEAGSEIVRKERKDGIDGMFWRFLAASDPEAEVVLVRDVDTRLTLRDKQSNDTWLSSEKDYHIVRDAWHHRMEMMGGLWACRGEKIPHIEQLVSNWEHKSFFWDDQIFLATKVYPWIRNFSYIQSDINKFREEEVHLCPPFTDIENALVSFMGGRAYPRPSRRTIAKDSELRQKFRKRKKYRLQQPMRVRLLLIRLIWKFPASQHKIIKSIKMSIQRVLVYEEPFLSIARWVDSLLPPIKYRNSQSK